jgi:hypothetical protein
LHKGIHACPAEGPAFDGPLTDKLAFLFSGQSVAIQKDFKNRGSFFRRQRCMLNKSLCLEFIM